MNNSRISAAIVWTELRTSTTNASETTGGHQWYRLLKATINRLIDGAGTPQLAPEKYFIAQFSSQIYCTTVLEYYSSICMSARGGTPGSYSTTRYIQGALARRHAIRVPPLRIRY